MFPRFRCVSVALAALLTVASVCQAAEPGYVPKKGGVGGGVGYSKMVEDADYSQDAAGRFAFSGALRYVINKRLRWQVSPGFEWSAYNVGSRAPFIDPAFLGDTTLAGAPIKDQMLTLVVPVSVQLQLTQQRGWWLYHFGAGPGIYRVWVENHRKVIEDPVSKDHHRGPYLGMTAELGAERFLRGLTTTSIEGVVAGHLIFAQRDTQFPSGFNSKLLPLDVRLCVNYYFDMTRRKKSIESGVPPKP